MPSVTEQYDQYKTALQKIADVKYASAVLQWDQETYLPPKGADMRGRQIATLAEIAHQQFTDPALGALLKALNEAGGLDEKQQRNVELSLEDYKRATKFSSSFVRELSEAINKSFHAWIQARKENDFTIFEPSLDALIQLKKKEANIIGFTGHPYDALMNDYDKGLTVAITDKVFNELRPQLLALLDKIKAAPQVDNSFLHQPFSKTKQWEFGMELLRRMGFDFEAGRQDISEHPFTTNFNHADVRVTTRIDENDLGNMAWSCIHEGGHALYEQGLPGEAYGLPLGEYCSLSIHESQSRLWENNIGRSLPYWQHNYPLAKHLFPEALSAINVEDFYKGINKVQPSLIRTEADELTYHFHVMIRYEIEKMLIAGTLATKDIPAYWNELYARYLGVTVPNDKLGCLQDVHWSHGSFGYFATYSLGSLYAAQFYNTISKNNPSLETETGSGDHASLLQWLRENIHQYGRFYPSEELCKKATGETLSSRYFMEYATKKFSGIYGL